MAFGSPQWLILIPAAIVLGWRFKNLRLSEPTRAICVVLLTLALSDPKFGLPGREMDLWVLVDRSDSARQSIAPRIAEWEGILERSRPSGSRLRFVDFAAAPFLREPGKEPEIIPSRTRTGLALNYTLTEIDPTVPSRVLLISDGFSTDSLEGVAMRYREAGIPIDLRLAPVDSANDVRIARFRLPSTTRIGEPFLLEARITGPQDKPLAYEVLKNGDLIHKGEVSLHNGEAFLRLANVSNGPGMDRYELWIHPESDSRWGNNQATSWVEVRGGRQILLITRFENDPVAAAIRAQGMDVQEITDPSELNPSNLAGTAAVIINDVAASQIPDIFLKALDFFVQSQGGGLAMIGGPSAFGSGGYFESPMDPLLPVSMELREEHRKLPVAIAFVMDRSGSMSAGTGPGATKMDLANEGVARSVELLGPKDKIAIFAVDSEAHEVVPLSTVGNNAPQIADTVRRVTSQGGGIYVYRGLEAAWRALQMAGSGQKHIILFADAADSEEPGSYARLIAEMRKEGATVSVIGLGSDSDSDAKLLRDIAQRGGGRIFFNADASQLPAIFSQETVAIARSTYIDQNTVTSGRDGWGIIGSRPPHWPSAVDGYNLTYVRPNASVALATADEYKAPLVAAWQKGSGHVAVITFPLSGPDATLARAWPAHQELIQSLSRWLEAEGPPPGTSLQTRVRGETAAIDFRFGPRYESELAESPPRLLVATGDGARELIWQRMSPGRFRAEVPLPESDWLRGVVELKGHRIPFGPIANPTNPEWDMDQRNYDEIKRVTLETGGRVLQDLTAAWTHPPTNAARSLQGPLLAALLAVFLVDCLLSRLGIEWKKLIFGRDKPMETDVASGTL